jgi:hypothetical protein
VVVVLVLQPGRGVNLLRLQGQARGQAAAVCCCRRCCAVGVPGRDDLGPDLFLLFMTLVLLLGRPAALLLLLLLLLVLVWLAWPHCLLVLLPLLLQPLKHVLLAVIHARTLRCTSSTSTHASWG